MNKMLKEAVGIVKKSIEHLFALFFKKARQVWDCFEFGGRRGIRFDTVRSETSKPSLSNSP